jgi:hypothetical protein
MRPQSSRTISGNRAVADGGTGINEAGNVIETHEQAGNFKEGQKNRLLDTEQSS